MILCVVIGCCVPVSEELVEALELLRLERVTQEVVRKQDLRSLLTASSHTVGMLLPVSLYLLQVALALLASFDHLVKVLALPEWVLALLLHLLSVVRLLLPQRFVRRKT